MKVLFAPLYVTAALQRRRAIVRAIAIPAIVAATILALRPPAVRADDLQDSAQQLSDNAFTLLNSMNADSSKAAGEVVGAIASFAGDAQTFSGALAKRDRADASQAMAALIADRRAVDAAIAKNPKAGDSRWDSIKIELASLQNRVPPASGPVAKKSSSEHMRPGVVPPPPSERPDVAPPAPSETAAAGPSPLSEDSPPEVRVMRRDRDGDGIHIKGYLQGNALKTAGIYDGEKLISPIQLSRTTEGQRVVFDFKLEDISATETIRCEDKTGRIAEARILPDGVPAEAEAEPAGHERMIELGGTGTVENDRARIVVASKGGANTAEIPSKSPSRRHIHQNKNVSPLTDVQINILGVLPAINEPSTFQVIGQISGEGVKRAAIYVDGKLEKPIPLTPGGYTSFDESFMMRGSEATVRAYGSGSNFVEASVDLNVENGAVYGANPPINAPLYPVNPYARRSPYGYSPSPYGSANPYAPPPYGYPNAGYPNAGYPPPSTPWWRKLF